MDAIRAAEVVIACVKISNLNFHIQESPFSLQINIRKTFIKNKNGDDKLPYDVIVEANNNEQKVNIEKLKSQLQNTQEALHEVSVELDKSKKEHLEDLHAKNTLLKEFQNIERDLTEKEKECKLTKNETKDIKASNDQLKRDLNHNSAIIKSKEQEIGSLKEKIENLEQKCIVDNVQNLSLPASTSESLSLSSNTSSSDSISSPSLPKSKNSKFSRSSSSPSRSLKCANVCKHSPQCVTREPFPPPFPSITFLHNENTKYHDHMMQWSKKEFAGCVKCFSIENENYGCADCRWLKFWYKRNGEIHGFPDMDPWIYKKYL